MCQLSGTGAGSAHRASVVRLRELPMQRCFGTPYRAKTPRSILWVTTRVSARRCFRRAWAASEKREMIYQSRMHKSLNLDLF